MRNNGDKLATKALTKAEAQKLESGMREDFQAAEDRLVAAAIKLDKFVRGEGWKALGFAYLGEWRDARMNYTEFYQLRRVQKLLEAGVPEEKVEQMKLTNIEVMATQLTPAQWNKPEWQKAAIDLPVKDFEEKARTAAHEQGTEVEQVFRRGFVASQSAVEQWDESLRVAEAVDGATRMDNKLDAVCGTYLNSASKQPGKTRRQRYEELRKIEESSN